MGESWATTTGVWRSGWWWWTCPVCQRAAGYPADRAWVMCAGDEGSYDGLHLPRTGLRPPVLTEPAGPPPDDPAALLMELLSCGTVRRIELLRHALEIAREQGRRAGIAEAIDVVEQR